MSLTVEQGVWGRAVDENVKRVFESVVDTFGLVGIGVTDPLHVVAVSGVPMAKIARGPNNSHVVEISEVDKKWDQYAYQFAHEYCHVFSQHSLVPLNSRFGGGKSLFVNCHHFGV